MNPLPLEISCADLHALRSQGSEFLLVDCREPDEHALVALPGATLLPMSRIAERVSELEDHKSEHLVIYCHLGIRSQRVAHWLREQGFERVQSLAGGIDQWAQEIEPQMARY